jgi:salicylate hydroxylase
MWALSKCEHAFPSDLLQSERLHLQHVALEIIDGGHPSLRSMTDGGHPSLRSMIERSDTSQTFAIPIH